MHKQRLVIALALGLVGSGVSVAAPQMEIGGVVEVEATSGEGSSDIAVATVELAIAARVNERVTADVVLLHEEDETPFGVDSATINVVLRDGITLTAGQTVVPFGLFESKMISDPLTLELAETSATVVQITDTSAIINASLYSFNGTRSGDDVNNTGLTLSYTSGALVIGVGYLSNIGDSDTIAAGTLDNAVPAMALNVSFSSGPLTLLYEKIGAEKSFKAGDDAAGGAFTSDAKPSASNFEVAYSSGESTFAIGWQTTDDAADLGLSEKRMLVAAATELAPSTTLAIEYASDDAYGGGSSSTTTIQLAVEF